ncbi:MAG: DNA polymerase III subunit beta [Candidatus Yanofskybacteria bacterium RIFCSPHIGHO2_02_FULL_41_29]|uniref:Beta sliding clamp n=1 Tax=Candidatus Yanofskybacteria bacterium RIFCSPHIGHO2_01_FULL_41_53 TaxID=1802663 RepID=A0A1F8EGZ4_9BACT|nr:MAG: DNA polymerase III subunit beta [Candidatus Yanofskybacteria bacterium RIFCSPHIGHO2_01_FULL_41_53]OGN10901.1 MAG: DNA polymerase III subunit beta [Candidatus Yanofskybacteria bacterium RIFCSPHIGHO2_02_FULL_41_29]OGN19322.1 MAG: DNA polymerase III subunit beta [Candidatus Yanofskybacteria bacterium RIFCSPHIGHO2_12_FULL_41_9]OGN21748.1 MAG: DNA polymerase III subunit beta [Candidatus Yanofskybacteria bacterium RIFCSPLOWO2_01_FULL_41_67]OGN29570.1 MAG: DNA polymerase III subunit beta [Cand
MKVTTNHKNLSKAVLMVEKIVSRNHSLPILSNILLKTENGRLKISATNLELGINYLLGSKIDETGEITVPARLFSEFINNLNEEKITLTTKNNILNINTDKYKTQILGFDPKDFPIIPKIKSDQYLNIPAKILKTGLSTIIDSMAISEARPELAGVFIQFTSKQLILASTDSFRLTEKIIELKNKENNSFILPRVTVLELIRLLGDLNDDILVKYSDNQISFSTDDIEIVSRLVDGNYPDYKKVIPEKYISRLLVRKNDLEKNVRLAGIFTSNIADIKLSCSEKNISINVKNSDKGEFQVVTEAVLKNEPFDISLNYYYLLDGLKIMPTENIIIEYTGQGSPLVLRPEHDNKDLTYIIMPLRK